MPAPEVTIRADESRRFAVLARDLNPLHLDPLVARRLPFGGTVVHGVHLLLRALDTTLSTLQGPLALSHLKVSFASPVRTGQACTVRSTGDGQHLQVDVEVAGRRVQRIAATLVPRPGGDGVALRPPESPPGVPRDLSFQEARVAHGSVPVRLDESAAAALFPTALEVLPAWQVAALLATTHIVGMQCPGLHSLFTEINLDFDPPCPPDAAAELSLSYRVQTADARFGVLVLRVEGIGVRGALTALLRPPPVAQPAFEDVRRAVSPAEFAAQRALVVGGSRGLGEVAAKVLAAGGADVWITYAAGRDDAARVADEIGRGGGRCGTFAFDVLDPPATHQPDLPTAWAPTHLYLFASPFIALNSGAWDPSLFASFASFYVTGTTRTLAWVSDVFGVPARDLVVFYPSTAYLDNPAKGLAEYAAAKAAGEAVCHYLAAQSGVRVRCPRLPRMLTDQTGLVRGASAAPLDVLPGVIREQAEA